MKTAQKNYLKRIKLIYKYVKVGSTLSQLVETFNEETPDDTVFPVYQEVRRLALKHQQTQLLRFRAQYRGIWSIIEKEAGLTASYLCKVAKGGVCIPPETWLKIESLSKNNPPSDVGRLLRPLYAQPIENEIKEEEPSAFPIPGEPSKIDDDILCGGNIFDTRHRHQLFMAYLHSQKHRHLKKTARTLGISGAHLSHVRDGKRGVSERIYRRVVSQLSRLSPSKRPTTILDFYSAPRPTQSPLPLTRDESSSSPGVSSKKEVLPPTLDAVNVVGNCLNGTLHLNTPWGDITVRLDDVRIAPIKSSSPS